MTDSGTTNKTVEVAGLMTVSQVCGMLPGRGQGMRRVHPSTITRWIISGCPATSGERIRLRATRCGSRWLIAPEALKEFFEALGSTATSVIATPLQQRRTDAQRAKAAAVAAERLKRMGA